MGGLSVKACVKFMQIIRVMPRYVLCIQFICGHQFSRIPVTYVCQIPVKPVVATGSGLTNSQAKTTTKGKGEEDQD